MKYSILLLQLAVSFIAHSQDLQYKNAAVCGILVADKNFYIVTVIEKNGSCQKNIARCIAIQEQMYSCSGSLTKPAIAY